MTHIFFTPQCVQAKFWNRRSPPPLLAASLKIGEGKPKRIANRDTLTHPQSHFGFICSDPLSYCWKGHGCSIVVGAKPNPGSRLLILLQLGSYSDLFIWKQKKIENQLGWWSGGQHVAALWAWPEQYTWDYEHINMHTPLLFNNVAWSTVSNDFSKTAGSDRIIKEFHYHRVAIYSISPHPP